MTASQEEGRATSFKRSYEKFCGLVLFLATTICALEIVVRVGFHTTYDFVLDFSVWLTVWAMLLVTGPLLLEPQGHVSIEFILEKLRGRSRIMLEAFNLLCTLAYGAAVTVGGLLLIRSLYLKKLVFPRYFPIPMWIVELCVPIGMGIFTVIAVVQFFRTLSRRGGLAARGQ
jgi:TRAP-type C4-dicarboxylate transport system permease small subunit